MTPSFHRWRALIVEGGGEQREELRDRLEALGHVCETARTVAEAREKLNGCHYILLGLALPLRADRPARPANGVNLLREIRAKQDYRDIPIVATGPMDCGLILAALRHWGATDYLPAPVPDSDDALEKAIMAALVTTGRARVGGATHRSGAIPSPPEPFQSGELVFTPSRVELCGVKICGGDESGVQRRILDALARTNGGGQRVTYSGAELADRVGASDSLTRKSIGTLRETIYKRLRKVANVEAGPQDVIASGGAGYRLAPGVTWAQVDEQPEPVEPVEIPADLTDRQRWALREAGQGLRAAAMAERLGISVQTARRDLHELRDRGLVEYVGPKRTGCWKACE